MHESPRARVAFADYLALGDGRSLEALATMYQSRPESAPTLHVRTLKEWSRLFNWQTRLAAIADQHAAAAAAELAALRRSIMDEGLALDSQRVAALKRLAGRLLEDLEDDDILWVKDVKQVGRERVVVERFNAAEVEQLRGALDDLAKETGGRQQRILVETEAARIAKELGLEKSELVALAGEIARGKA